jgi:hypothetical protein
MPMMSNKEREFKKLQKQILLIQSMSIVHFFVMIDHKQDYLRIALSYSIFLMLVHACLKQVQVQSTRGKSIYEEIFDTRKQKKFFKSEQDVEQRMRHVYPASGPDKSNEWYYVNRHHGGQYYVFRMNLLYDELSEQLVVFSKLSADLMKSKRFCRYGWPLIPVSPDANTSAIRFFKTWLPFHWAGDIPSQTRLYALYMVFKEYMKFTSIGSTFLSSLSPSIDSDTVSPLLSEKNPVASSMLVINALFALYGAYLLNEQRKLLALKGIERRVTPYFSYPPTCIGQQFSAQHLFVGDNRTMRLYMTFLVDMLNYIDDLEVRCNGEASLRKHPLLARCVQARKALKEILYLDDNNHLDLIDDRSDFLQKNTGYLSWHEEAKHVAGYFRRYDEVSASRNVFAHRLGWA